MTSADVCGWVLNKIETSPASFCQEEWMLDSENCGSIGCIAGWVGRLFGDEHNVCYNVSSFDEYTQTEQEWKERQASRLGLGENAGDVLFHTMNNTKAKLMLKMCHQYLADGNSGVGLDTMRDFSYKAESII